MTPEVYQPTYRLGEVPDFNPKDWPDPNGLRLPMHYVRPGGCWKYEGGLGPEVDWTIDTYVPQPGQTVGLCENCAGMAVHGFQDFDSHGRWVRFYFPSVPPPPADVPLCPGFCLDCVRSRPRIHPAWWPGDPLQTPPQRELLVESWHLEEFYREGYFLARSPEYAETEPSAAA